MEVIQELKVEHAPIAAEIHIEGQPGTFLTSLGQEFLTVLYAQMCASPWGFGCVALSDGQVVGLVAAAVNTSALFKEIIWRRWYRLVWPLTKQLWRHPSLLTNTLQTLSYPGQEAAGAELLFIGVRARLRGQGLGRRLVEALGAECRARSISNLEVTVDVANQGANRFYRRHGFQYQRTFELYGRQMNSYKLELANHLTSPAPI